MEAQEFKKLLDRYIAGESTAEENAWLESWYMDYGKNNLPLKEQELLLAQRQIWAQFNEKNSFQVKRTATIRRSLWLRIAAAAAILLIVGLSIFFYNSSRHLEGSAATRDLSANHIKPGSNKAYLILSNGKRLSLTDAANGAIAKEAGVEITKTADGQVIYQTGPPNTALNTIETPRGGLYQIQLPDGSKVWLNAASKLIYPVSFIGRGQREVSLDGEAYFEISKNKLQPFVVKSKNQEVTVLGTHFNINSYSDEPTVKTTLLEGSVKLKNAKEEVVLIPGQEAIVQNKQIHVVSAAVQDAVAWKNGYFAFHDEKIESILRKLSRWYNIHVEYEGDIPEVVFDGEIPRNLELSQVLKALEAVDVHFTLTGNKLIVKP